MFERHSHEKQKPKKENNKREYKYSQQRKREKEKTRRCKLKKQMTFAIFKLGFEILNEVLSSHSSSLIFIEIYLYSSSIRARERETDK